MWHKGHPNSSLVAALQSLANGVQIVIAMIGLTCGPVLAVPIGIHLVRTGRAVAVGVATAQELRVVRRVGVVDMRMCLHQMWMYLAQCLILQIVY